MINNFFNLDNGSDMYAMLPTLDQTILKLTCNPKDLQNDRSCIILFQIITNRYTHIFFFF